MSRYTTDLKAVYGMTAKDRMDKVVMKKTITDLDINPFRQQRQVNATQYESQRNKS